MRTRCDCINTAPQPSGWIIASAVPVHWKDCPVGRALLERMTSEEAEVSTDGSKREGEWTPPRRVYFKRQTLNMWRVTDSDGQRMVNADQAFAQMQELVEDGWRLNLNETVTGSIRSVECTEPGR